MKNNISNAGYILLLSFFLALGFYSNFYKTADQLWFNTFHKGSDSLVLGRLIMSSQFGVFSKGGLTGRIKDIPFGRNTNLYQYEIFKNGIEVEEESFDAYKSLIGGQAITFSLLDKLLPFKKSNNLKLYWFITSFLTGLILALFLFWVRKCFGFFPSFICFFFILGSAWMTVFGKSLWWSLWSFFIPFVIFLFYFEKEEKDNLVTSKQLLSLSFFSVLVKVYFTGYEYITTTLIMSITPFVFYAVKDKWSFIILAKRLMLFSISSFVAILVSFGVLIYQLKALTGSYFEGIEHITYSFFKRTHSTASYKFSEIYSDSLETDIFSLLTRYLLGNAIDLAPLFSSVKGGGFFLTFADLIILFILFTILVFLSRKQFPTLFKKRKLNIALLYATWFSILAPLSWFIIFKGHSYLHFHMNFIVWYMPFCLLGFALLGSVLCCLIKDVFVDKGFDLKKNIILFCISAAFLITVLIKPINTMKNIYTLRKITKIENIVYEDQKFTVYIYDDTIWFESKEKLSDVNKLTFVLDKGLARNDKARYLENIDEQTSNILKCDLSKDLGFVNTLLGSNERIISFKKLPSDMTDIKSVSLYLEKDLVWSVDLDLN